MDVELTAAVAVVWLTHPDGCWMLINSQNFFAQMLHGTSGHW